MTLEERVARHREAVAKLGPPDVRNVQPSIRDFARYVTTDRAELCVIAECATPEEARASEEAGAYVIALPPEISAAEVRAFTRATQIPLLARGIVLDESDLYRLRDAGADGATVHAKLHSAERLTALWRAARSMRMEILVEASDEPSLALALASEAKVIGAPASLVPRIPKGRAPVLCERHPDPRSLPLDAAIVPAAEVLSFA